MGKKGNEITINCDSTEVAGVLMHFFRTYAEQIEETIKQGLGQQGVQSDPTLKINKDGSIKVSKANYDKGVVLIAETSDSLKTGNYKELTKGSIYALPHRGQFGVFQKTNNGIDLILGHFANWGNLVEGLATVKPVEEKAEAEAEATVVESEEVDPSSQMTISE